MIKIIIEENNIQVNGNKIEFSNSTYLQVIEDKIFYINKQNEAIELKANDEFKIGHKKIKVLDFSLGQFENQRKILNKRFEEIQRESPHFLGFLKKFVTK